MSTCIAATLGSATLRDAKRWLRRAWGSATAVKQGLFAHENGTVALKEPPNSILASEPGTDEELLQVIVTRILLESYFGLCRGSLVVRAAAVAAAAAAGCIIKGVDPV